MSEPIPTALTMAQRAAHLLGGNGLSTNQQVELLAVELGGWVKAAVDYAVAEERRWAQPTRF